MIGFGEFWELDVALLALNSFAQAAFAQASSSTGRAQTAKQQSSARWTTLPDIDLPEDRFMFAVSCCILIIWFYKDIPVPAKKQAGIGTNRRNHGKPRLSAHDREMRRGLRKSLCLQTRQDALAGFLEDALRGEVEEGSGGHEFFVHIGIIGAKLECDFAHARDLDTVIAIRVCH